MHNFSDATLDQVAENILFNGFNFSIILKSVHTRTIIIQVETVIWHFADNTAEEIRQVVATILKTASFLLTLYQLKNYNNNPNIIILPAGRCNVTTVLNNAEYIQKMRKLVVSLEYEITEKDPSTLFEKETKSFINNLKLPQDIEQPTIVRETSLHTLWIFHLSMIHKPNIRLRPIVSFLWKINL